MGIKCGHCCFPQQPHFLPSLSVSKVSVASRHPPLQGWSAATATSLGDRALSLLCPGRERRHVLLSCRDGSRPLLLPSDPWDLDLLRSPEGHLPGRGGRGPRDPTVMRAPSFLFVSAHEKSNQNFGRGSPLRRASDSKAEPSERGAGGAERHSRCSLPCSPLRRLARGALLVAPSLVSLLSWLRLRWPGGGDLDSTATTSSLRCGPSVVE